MFGVVIVLGEDLLSGLLVEVVVVASGRFYWERTGRGVGRWVVVVFCCGDVRSE
jgi:hypothetical protein